MAGDDLVPGSTSASHVLRILGILHGADVETWVAGGWGIDALLGAESREHRDLDVLIPHSETIASYETLRGAGFRLTTDRFPTRFEMIDGAGSVVDVHPIRLLEGGGAELELTDGRSWTYEASSLDGHGVIGDEPVRCLSVEEQVRTHVGYEPTAVDIGDMRRLAQRFGLDLPEPYRNPSEPP
jgi:lincosamide nucleotidyltransferase A/C/D/E